MKCLLSFSYIYVYLGTSRVELLSSGFHSVAKGTVFAPELVNLIPNLDYDNSFCWTWEKLSGRFFWYT